MSGQMLVGLDVGRSAWSAPLRAHLHDYLGSVDVEMILDRTALFPAGRQLDVVVTGDSSRLLTAGDVQRLVEAGTVVVGIHDPAKSGRSISPGARYLSDLGVSRLVPSTATTKEIAETIAAIGPVRSQPVARPPIAAPRPGIVAAGQLTAISVTGEAGATEIAVGLADALYRRRRRTLLIEANPIGSTLASRLHRRSSFGLGWTLSLIAQGRKALPDGLTPTSWDDGQVGCGHFDVIVGTPTPEGPPPATVPHLDQLVDEALAGWDQVVIDTGPLVGGTGGAAIDRFAAPRHLLARATRILTVATPDPDGARAAVEWLAAADKLNLPPATLLFSPASRSRYERDHLEHLVAANTDRARTRFNTVRFLSADPKVARARWNGELVTAGRWHREMTRLATDLLAQPVTAPVPEAREGRDALIAALQHTTGSPT